MYIIETMSSEYELTVNNKRIFDFYKENANIDFETGSILMIEIFEKVFDKATKDQSTSINSQILAFMTDNRRQMELLKTNVSSIQENVSKMNSDIGNQIMIQFVNSKKEYIEDVKQIISNSSLTTHEKITSVVEKNNSYLIDKTSLILSENIPKNQEQINRYIKDMYQSFKQELDYLTSTLSGEKSNQEFINKFESKFSFMLQSVQQPLYSFFTASEDRISKNITELKEASNASSISQSKMVGELSDFLGKYKKSGNKGKFGEEKLCSILKDMFPSSDLVNTSGRTASGDFIMKRTDKPVILFETKEYENIVDKDEVAKFIRDVDIQNVNGIFMSQHSGISLKNNYQIDINKGNILVYIQNCEYSDDKIRVAVDIIDSLSSKIEDLNMDDENSITKELLDEINKEYIDFVLQKENSLAMLREFQRKMTTQIESIKMPSLEKYLEPKYTCVSNVKILTCDLCNVYNASSRQSLSAHIRGCKKKMKLLENTVV